MTTEKGLLDSIWDAPHDDVPRLVYADWLDESGDEANAVRAELIRVQVDLARLPGDDDRFDALEKREGEILRAHKKGWWSAMPKGCRKGRFHRGFPIPSLSAFSIDGMVRLGAERLKAAPLWRYHYGVHGTDMDALLDWPWLDRLDLFALRPPLPDGWADRVAESPGTRNVSELALIDCHLEIGDVERLLEGWTRRRLRDLTLAADIDTGDYLALILHHPTMNGVRGLDIRATGLTADGLGRLLKSPHLGSLIGLNLARDPIGEDGLVRLLGWPGLSRLRWLGLSQCGLTDAAVALFAIHPAVANLKNLVLSDNQIGLAGAKALAESPYLGDLRSLTVYSTPLLGSSEAVAALKKRFGKRVSGLPGR